LKIQIKKQTNNPPNVGMMKLRDRTTSNLFVPSSYNVSEEEGIYIFASYLFFERFLIQFIDDLSFPESGVKIIVRKPQFVLQGQQCSEDSNSFSLVCDEVKRVRLVQTKRFSVYSFV
jgi:hypothetical protein